MEHPPAASYHHEGCGAPPPNNGASPLKGGRKLITRNVSGCPVMSQEVSGSITMKTIVLDFETYYDNDFSLRKMTPVEYILDPRFETIGCAVRDDGNTFWLEPHELVDYLAKLPPKVAVVSHNALFDMCILAWKFNYVPHMMIDTLGMARAWLGH